MQYKQRLMECLILALETSYKTALDGAERAHLAATDKANIPENKYDTLALEASYLAEGYAKRAAECKASLNAVKNLGVVEYSQDDAICVGTFVSLVDQDNKALSVFLAPVSGGVKFVFEEQTIIVITQSSPIGKVLLGKFVDDEFEIGSGSSLKRYVISAIA